VSLSSHHPPRSNAKVAALFVAAALMFVGFVSLGVWQVKRLAWKEDLIARIDRQVRAVPQAAPAVPAWPALQRERDEYKRLSVSGVYQFDHEALVSATTELGSGYWVITPLRTTHGFWVLVNRGFVSPEQRESAKRPSSASAGEQALVGLLRLSEPGGRLLQTNDAAKGRWYSRDVQAIAQAAGLSDAPVAPYFVDLMAPEQGANDAWPRPGLTVLQFTNNHLVYALTWFALAAMTAGALGYILVDERRLRRLAAERLGHAQAHA
jgi:surfeit locus 1 family protein